MSNGVKQFNNEKSFTHLNFLEKNLGGFTLTELLVVTGIIIMLSAIILPQYRTGDKSLALQRSAHKVSQDLRRAQAMAMSAQEITNPNNPSEKVLPPGGYGIYFGPLASPNYYIIFADCNENQKFDSGNVCGTPLKFSEKIEEIKLESKVQIASFSPSPLHITFVPPDPTININDSQATIILSNNVQTKTIIVTKAGLIYVE